MTNISSPTEFAAAVGISVPYASQILNGQRDPSRALAITIFRRTGQKLGPIAGASDDDIEMLARFEAAKAA